MQKVLADILRYGKQQSEQLSPGHGAAGGVGGEPDVRLKGLVWGGGFEWVTVVYDVSLISYAQCGLDFQFHRPESQIYSNLGYLYQRRYGLPLTVRNVPNKCLLDEKVYPPRT
jgi:hypothetical protein